MKAIVNTGPNQMQWLDWPEPQPGPGQVRIRTAACGICATDLEMIAGWQRTGFPSIPGHEWSGIVDAVGEGVERMLIGRPCVADNVLADGGEVGFEHAGGYGQYLLTDARNVRPLRDDFPLHVAPLIEPVAVCVRGLRRMRLEDRRSAIIFGDGTIGLIMLMLLKAHGVERLELVGGRDARLQLGREIGATQVWNYHNTDVSEVVGPYPNIVEASGSAAGMARALDIAATGAKVLVLGDYGDGRADFAWNRLLHRELELIGSNASAGAWPEAVRLATSHTVPLELLVSRCMPASSCTEAIDLVRRSRDMIKVVLTWKE